MAFQDVATLTLKFIACFLPYLVFPPHWYTCKIPPHWYTYFSLLPFCLRGSYWNTKHAFCLSSLGAAFFLLAMFLVCSPLALWIHKHTHTHTHSSGYTSAPFQIFLFGSTHQYIFSWNPQCLSVCKQLNLRCMVCLFMTSWEAFHN